MFAASMFLMVGSLLLEAFSKFQVFRRFGQIANDSDSEPYHFAIHIREAEEWLYMAVGCAVIGTLIAALAKEDSGKRLWWFRSAVLAALIFWPLLALLYFVGLPYPIVGIGYSASFGVLLVRILRRDKRPSGTTKTEQGTDDQQPVRAESDNF